MPLKQKKSRAAVTKLLDAINNETYETITEPPADSNTSTFKVIHAPSEKCFPWKFANRIEQYINKNTCSELIENIKSSGQKIPVIGRVISDGYEVICGIRRLYACKTLQVPILIALVDVSDKEALLIMDAENRSRLDISPLERALDYKKWIDTGIYKNYKEIQELTGIKKSWFSQLMSLVELHTNIVSVFGNPMNLKQKWGYHLRTLCKDNKNLEKILKTIDVIKNKNYKPRTIYSKLLLSCSTFDQQKEEEIIKNENGEVVFLIKKTRGNINIIIKKSIREHDERKIKEYLKSLLE